MNCPYCNSDLGKGLSVALSHDCCAKNPVTLIFKDGKPIGYVYFMHDHFKIIASSYMNTTVVYKGNCPNGILLYKVFMKVNSFIYPKDIDKKFKTILVFS